MHPSGTWGPPPAPPSRGRALLVALVGVVVLAALASAVVGVSRSHARTTGAGSSAHERVPRRRPAHHPGRAAAPAGVRRQGPRARVEEVGGPRGPRRQGLRRCPRQRQRFVAHVGGRPRRHRHDVRRDGAREGRRHVLRRRERRHRRRRGRVLRRPDRAARGARQDVDAVDGVHPRARADPRHPGPELRPGTARRVRPYRRRDDPDRPRPDRGRRRAGRRRLLRPAADELAGRRRRGRGVGHAVRHPDRGHLRRHAVRVRRGLRQRPVRQGWQRGGGRGLPRTALDVAAAAAPGRVAVRPGPDPGAADTAGDPAR